MKKYFSALLLGLLLLNLANAQDVVELDFWHGWAGDQYRPVAEGLIEQFNEEHPGIRINPRAIENEQFFTVLRTAFTSGNPPDIFTHEANNNLYQFVVPGEIEDISDWFAESGRVERFSPGTLGAVSYEGSYYGMPLNMHTATQIYYNVAILEENGIDPTTINTYAGLLGAFDTLKEVGVTPIAFGNKFGWPGSQWFYAFLARIVGAEKTNQLLARNCDYSWTDSDVVAAAQSYIDLADNGYFSSGMASDDYPTATALFFAGRAGFFHTGSWFISETIGGAPPNFELGILKLPAIENGLGTDTDSVLAVLGGLSLSARGAEDPAKREAALSFMDWWTDLPQQIYWVETIGEISTTAGAVSSETASPLIMQIVNEQVEGNTGAIPFIEHVTDPSVGEDRIWMGGVGVLTGQLNAEAWMASVEEAAANSEPILVLDPVCTE
jgi:raffinose/stachyose/melibiose transport system substrate-binding protein